MKAYRFEYISGLFGEHGHGYVEAPNKNAAYFAGRDLIKLFERYYPRELVVTGYKSHDGVYHALKR